MGLELDDTAVLLTGASSGIGAALAPRLAAKGARLGLVARRRERLEQVAEECRSAGGKDVRVWSADLSDVAAAENHAREIDAALGGVDLLINNAGAPMRRPVQRLTSAEIERTMRLNFLSPASMTLALLPGMLERGRGSIVNVSSLGGRLGILSEAAYSASKFALAGWSEAIAADLWGTGVEVRLINPGAIDTEIWDQPDNDPPFYDGDLESPGDIAEGIIAAIEGDTIEHYLPDMRAVIDFKSSDLDGFVAGLAAQKNT